VADVAEGHERPKESTVPRTKTVRHKAATKTLTTAQVRRLLYDIGIMVRITSDLEKAVLADAQRARGLGRSIPTVAA
jgi:hypothetical protein